MKSGGGESRLAAPVARSAAYCSAEPELRVALAAVRLAVFAVTIQFVAALVAAALTGWALTMDPAGSTVAISHLRVSPEVQQMVTTAVRTSTWAGVAFGVTLLLAALATLRWESRALRNLPALGLVASRPAWVSWLAWFVPAWGLLATQQTLDDLWRSGDRPGPGEHQADRPDPTTLPGTVSLWWGLWVFANVGAGVLVLSVWRDDRTAGALLEHQLISGALALILLGAGLLLPRVLAQTTARQDARHLQLTRPSAARPTSTRTPSTRTT